MLKTFFLVLAGRVSCGIHLAVVHLVGVEVGALLASLCMAFLVLGFDTTESAPFASRHQVPAYECQISVVVAPEEVAFVVVVVDYA